MITRNLVLTVGVLFHLIYLRSIFDIYFKSPVVSVNEQFSATFETNGPDARRPPADRLFLIVGDGLRADKLFENPHLAPFLHERVLNDGRWGISHTRVPTESRPGHVALIAGLYEDVSAVTTGWTLNPVHFDSVFNQSRNTWAWGSPDILPMFREGATDKDRITCTMYDPEEEDFTQASDKLDTWVFDHVESFLQDVSNREALESHVKQDQTVFFLHLLGLDSAGHAHRPYSEEYLNNIATVDQGIAQLVRTLEATWTAEEVARTAFLFTADHGMSDWGSHGDGHPDNTRTPYIAWGSGIRQSSRHAGQQISRSRHLHQTANETLQWAAEDRERVDIAQADLAVLMSYLLGIPYPKNNVGRLPEEVLSANTQSIAVAVFQNARQIHAQYAAKANHKAKQLQVSQMIPFDFSIDYLQAGMHANESHDWTHLQVLSEQWISESLEGMKYLQRYDWLFLRSAVTLGYLGWMLFALIFVFKSYVLPYSRENQDTTKEAKIEHLMGPKVTPGSATQNSSGEWSLLQKPAQSLSDQWLVHTPLGNISSGFLTHTIFVGIAAATIAYLLDRSAPISYYAYSAFPIFFWHQIALDLPALLTRTSMTSFNFSGLGIAALGLSIVQGIVKAYEDRRIISVMWPLASLTPLLYRGSTSLVQFIAWSTLCCLMASFTALPTVQTEDTSVVILGGCLMFLVGLIYLCIYGGSITLGAQVGLVALTTVVTKEAATSLQRKAGLPLGCQVFGWVALALSLVLPLCHRLERESIPTPQQRLMVLFLTFAPTFIILSVSYEGLFYLVFWALLVSWLDLETRISKVMHGSTSTHRGLRFSDARIALYFFFLIQAAFFGTGNIASVSSFSLDSVYRLIPIFNPFAMSMLLMFKLLVPFVVISAVLGLLNQRLGVPRSAIFMTVLTFCDILTLNFFWMVKDEGSWLEIGSSISAFVIGGLLILFVITLENLSEWIV